MRTFFIATLLFCCSLCITTTVFAAKEVMREGMCGTRTAQPGPDPRCDPSEDLCYIKIYYDDGTIGWTRLIVYEPSIHTAHDYAVGVQTYGFNVATGSFYYHIDKDSQTLTFQCETLKELETYIASKP